jgi:hypothetical protein
MLTAGRVAARLKLQFRLGGKRMRAIVNDALRLGLGLVGKSVRPLHFEVRPHAFGFKSGIDLYRINQLVDELESEETARNHLR